MLKKKALKAAVVRKAPPMPIRAEPAATAPRRTPATLMPALSAAAGLSPTARIASPTGVRASTHARTGTTASANSVGGVSAPSTGPSHGIASSQPWTSAKGWTVGGDDTFGKSTR
jgi:hypothetical protein